MFSHFLSNGSCTVDKFFYCLGYLLAAVVVRLWSEPNFVRIEETLSIVPLTWFIRESL